MEILKVKDVAESHGLKCLLFGMAGVGKTSMSITTPEPDKTLILSAESGLLSIKESELDVVVIKSIEDLIEAYEFLKTNDKYSWIILDSISEIAEVVLGHEKTIVKDMRQAYGSLAERMVNLCKGFRDMPNVNVCFIAKEQTVTDDFSPTTHQPMFPGTKLTKELPYLFDLCLCLRMKTNEETGEVKRAVMCMPNENYNTIKDRSGQLSSFEEPSWSVIYKKIIGEK